MKRKKKSNFKSFFGKKDIQKIINDCNISKQTFRLLYDVLKEKELNMNEQKTLAYFIKYNITDDFSKRLTKIKKFRHRMTKENFILRYGKKEGLKRIEARNEKSKGTLKTFISRHGKKEGTERYNDYVTKIKYTNSEQYYIDSFGKIEGKKKWEIRKKSCQSTSIECFVSKYGEKEGTKRYNNYVTIIKYKNSKQYLIDEYGEKEADIKWKNKHKNKNTKIQYWIDKGYNKEDAEKFKKRQIKWQKTMKSKPLEEITRINKLKAHGGSIYSVSKAEIELNEILKCETQHPIKTNDSWFFYDLRKGNKLIEYNGDYWHCNPEKYKSTYFNTKLKMTASEKWMKDEFKIKYAESKGYEVLIIWEKEYKKKQRTSYKKNARNF